MAATDSRTGWVTPTLRVADVDARRQAADDSMISDGMIDEPKWAAWKVTVAVVVFCAAFWTGIGYLAVRVLG